MLNPSSIEGGGCGCGGSVPLLHPEPGRDTQPHCLCQGMVGGDPRGIAKDDVGCDFQRPNLRNDIIIEVPAREEKLDRVRTPKTHPKAHQTLRAALCPSAHPLQCSLAHRGSEILGHLDKDNGVRWDPVGAPLPSPGSHHPQVPVLALPEWQLVPRWVAGPGHLLRHMSSRKMLRPVRRCCISRSTHCTHRQCSDV